MTANPTRGLALLEQEWSNAGPLEVQRIVWARYVPHTFLKTCRETDEQTLQRWVSATSPAISDFLHFDHDCLYRELRAHLLCADLASRLGRGAGPDDVPPDDVQSVAKETRLCVGLIRDLTLQLLPSPAEITTDAEPVTVAALLVTTEEQAAVVADLTLELRPGGSQKLYPAPELALVRRDIGTKGRRFCDAERNARAYALKWWPRDRDVRWRLEMRDGKPVPPTVRGDSAGGAFALGLTRLLAGEA